MGRVCEPWETVLSHVHVLEEEALTQFPVPLGSASSSWEDT